MAAAVTALTFASLLLSSCKDDDDTVPTDELYYNLEMADGYQIPSVGIDRSSFGKGKKIIIRSNGRWTIESASENCDWIRMYPMEGEEDGYIRLYADENTRAATRTAQFRVTVNGVPQPDMITVVQKAAKPFLNISSKALIFKRTGGEIRLDINANIDWEYQIEGVDAASFTAESDGHSAITVKATGINESGSDISATLSIRSTGSDTDITHTVTLTQLYATFFDNFSWVKSNAGILGWKIATGGKEQRIDTWTDEEKEHGWSSQSTWIYSRTGFLKFGKGGYGGDLASPRITELEGAANVTVSWCALGYTTAKGVRDDIDYYFVGILGDGTITGTSNNGATGASFQYKGEDGETVTLNAARFELGDKAWLDPTIDPTATEIWNYETSRFSIIVEGFTPQSRVVYVTGTGDIDNKYKNTNSKNSRLFLDNFKVVEN